MEEDNPYTSPGENKNLLEEVSPEILSSLVTVVFSEGKRFGRFSGKEFKNISISENVDTPGLGNVYCHMIEMDGGENFGYRIRVHSVQRSEENPNAVIVTSTYGDTVTLLPENTALPRRFFLAIRKKFEKIFCVL